MFNKALTYSYTDILKIALPLAVGNMAYTLIAVFDVYFMKEVGVAEQGAIGYAGLVYSFLFMVGFAYTKGSQILVAGRRGGNREQKIGEVVNSSIAVLLLFALIIFLAITFRGRTTLGFLFQDKEVIDAAVEYLNIRRWAFFFSFTGAVFIAYYSGIERTYILAAAIVTMSFLNILLNYVLIFGKLGFPALGIRGAAWASNIAEIVSLLILLAGTLRRKRIARHGLFLLTGLSRRVISEISRLSFPLVIQSLIGLGAWLIFFTMIENYMGQEALASSQVVRSIYMLLGVSTFAFASSTHSVVGNLSGAGKIDEIIPSIKRIALLSVALIALFTLPVFLIPTKILSFFAEPPIVKLSMASTMVALGALFIYAVATVIFNGIVAVGKTYVSLSIEFATITFYSLFLYILFHNEPPSLAVAWLTEWLYWGAIGLLSLFYFKWGNWQNAKRLDGA